MTMYLPDLEGRAGPKYRRIADTIGDDIRSGTLPAGTKLPTHRDLAYRLGVTVGTVSRAYQELLRRGLTGGRVGSGTYVLPHGGARPVFSQPHPPLLDMCGEQKDTDAARENWHRTRTAIADPHAASNFINLGMNRPPPGPEAEALAQTLAELPHQDGVEILTRYNPSPGMPHHRDAMATLLAEVGLTTHGDEVLMTHGAQHAITSAALAVLNAGDVVLTEDLTYPGFASLMSRLGVRVHPVAMDDEGIIPNAFEAAIQATGARVAYLVPVLQNPTTATMSLARLEAIAEIAKRNDVIVIEDDVYGFQPETRNPPLAEIAPNHTIYINGFAKTFAPGLRVGIMRPPQTLFNDIAQTVQITGWMVAPLMGEIATRWVHSGAALNIMEWHRQEMRERHAIAMDILSGFKVRGGAESLHVWLTLPDSHSADNAVRALADRGVTLVTSENFTVGATPAPNALRICLGAPLTREDLTTGVTKLRDHLLSESSNTRPHHETMVM